jgi:phosphoglycerol transferase MdoB-like AlkP superfamily enzyme
MHSLISRNLREWMFVVVQISLLIVIFLSLISWNLSLMQTTQEVTPHLHIAPCVNVWSVFFFFLLSSYATCWMLVHASATSPGKAKWSDHTSVGGRKTYSNCPHICFVLFHSVTYYYSTIAGSCKNNSKIKNWKKPENMNPIERMREILY